MQEHNVRINLDKCKFLQESVEYLGHKIDKNGVSPILEKLEAIRDAPAPTNLHQLRSWLGLVNYYNKYLPMASTKLKPLYDLERKDVAFIWTTDCDKSFNETKKALMHSKALAHYNPELPVVIATDASPYGIGAVMSHIIDGIERPVIFISSTLSKSEQNYAQLHKEALAIIFAIRKLHKYIYGRRFTLITDHQPLKTIFSPQKNIPVMAASRLKRWALELSAYDYQIQYRKGEYLANADAMSRLPKPEIFEEPLYSFSSFSEIPLRAIDIANSTKKDQVLSKVYEYTLRGWPERMNQQPLLPYFHKRHELALENQCIYWGNRIIIPYDLRSNVIELLHDQHIGIVRMKMLARGEVWWPNIDIDIENNVNRCETCQIHLDKKVQVPLTPWPKCGSSWKRLHIDFFELNSVHFLIIVDSYSKWLDIHIMQGTNAEKTIEKLRSTFAIFGIPEELVSDNGPPFNGREYKEFCNQNGIKCTLTPPLHPCSNGMAEKQVHTIKKNLKKQIHEQEKNVSKKSLQHMLDNFLLKFRTTPHSVTGVSPAERLLRQLPRTRLTMLKTNQSTLQQRKEEKVKDHANKKRGSDREYEENETVLVLSKRSNKPKWERGKIYRKISKVTYLVWLEEMGKMKYMHADDIRKSLLTDDSSKVEINGDSENRAIELPHLPVVVNETPEIPADDIAKESEPIIPKPPSPNTSTPPDTRKSSRLRKKPEKLDL